jgi:hypothetical protein
MTTEEAIKIIQAQGEVQMMKREWWQLYKRGWYKHRDFWNRRWWIRFKWNADSNVPQQVMHKRCFKPIKLENDA